ncbi:MAG TPA: PSP1 domain-containing protein, partial [bacterium]|nr:PSP1 domain-containing protein [bacterium]
MDVIDIKIRDRRMTARFREAPLDLRPPSYCLVEVDGDREFAKVKSPPYTWEEALPPAAEAFVLAPAQAADFEVVRANRVIEREAFRFCLEKVRERQLPMALAAVERSFDGKKMRFFFTADNRIDFRELVKDLASAYRTRI